MILLLPASAQGSRLNLVGTVRFRRPRRVQRRNMSVNRTLGMICSARCYAGGDAANAATLPKHRGRGGKAFRIFQVCAATVNGL